MISERYRWYRQSKLRRLSRNLPGDKPLVSFASGGQTNKRLDCFHVRPMHQPPAGGPYISRSTNASAEYGPPPRISTKINTMSQRNTYSAPFCVPVTIQLELRCDLLITTNSIATSRAAGRVSRPSVRQMDADYAESARRLFAPSVKPSAPGKMMPPVTGVLPYQHRAAVGGGA